MQEFLISLYNSPDSCLPLLKTIKSGNFLPSAFAVRQTKKQVFSCPVVFTVTDFLPVSSTVVAETISARHGFHPWLLYRQHLMDVSRQNGGHVKQKIPIYL